VIVLLQSCELCQIDGGAVLWRNTDCRVVLVDDPHFIGFTRVMWRRHVGEMTDLSFGEQQHLWRVVMAVEAVMRACLLPDKVNLASLGNVVPHLHWHIIPRWRDDTHFPNPIWGQSMREFVLSQSRQDRLKLYVEQLSSLAI
jgi:diadenosine tetraphosphate (Ap4A) HIT family hydrolase